MKLRWRYGVIAGLFLAVFSLYPQFILIYNRGADWNGHYAYNDIDEVAYAAYVAALVDGRPRKNDPYTGRDDTAEHPQPETLFSIQFAAPYMIAIPAQLLGISAPWAMTLSGAMAAFLAGLAVFWLLFMMLGDSVYAMSGTLFVFAFGALFAGEGAIGAITGNGFAYPYFPGFRRYVPALALAAFFGFLGVVWKLLSDDRCKWWTPLLAIVAFGYTVFSYFYIWTMAAAWLGSVGLCLLVVRPVELRRSIKPLVVMVLGCVATLIPYAYFLSDRSRTMDEVQLLVRTHAPDLHRAPEIISIALVGMLLLAVAIGKVASEKLVAVFAASLCVSVVVVFNQQVITGRSLQPIHYEVFIGNYVTALAAVVLTGVALRHLNRAVARAAFSLVLFIVSITWGFIECHYTVHVLEHMNVTRDEALPVARRVGELARSRGRPRETTVLHMGLAEADDLPTVAPVSLLWARHQHVFAGVTWQENKERYYQQIYFEGVTPVQLASGMKSGRDYVSTIALFGWGRHTDRLNAAYRPLTFGEIDHETSLYNEYILRYDPRSASAHPIDYVIARVDDEEAFEMVDRWYVRDAGEIWGPYVLHNLTLR